MTDSGRLDLRTQAIMKQALAGRARGDGPTPECLDDDTLAALAEGSLEAAARAAALAHVAGCAHCRAGVASVARALDDPAVAGEVVALTRLRHRWLKVALPAAAAAAVLLLAWPRAADDDLAPHRAPSGSTEALPVPVAPIGAVAGAPMLQWRALSGADRYRVTLFDDAGRVLYEVQVGDTVVPLPDSVRLVAGRTYLWKVEGRTAWDRWSASDLVEFSIPAGAAP